MLTSTNKSKMASWTLSFTGVKPRLEFSIGIDISLLDMLSCIIIYSEFLKEHSSVYEHVVGQQGIESSRVRSEFHSPLTYVI